MNRFSRLLWVIGFCVFVLAGAAYAQTPTLAPPSFDRSVTPPDINAVPILSNIVKSGAKLYYLGERSGLYGWLIVKDGQIQMIYVTADKKTALIGGMFTSEGENVTGPQIVTLAETSKEVADIISTPAKQQEDISRAGSTPGGIASVPGGNPITGGGNNVAAVPTVSLSPGERLMQDLQAAAGVTLGRNESAEIIMVLSPSCPHCKTTWRELRESVMGNRLQVRLVPVTNDPKSDETRAGAQLLKVANPLDVWDRYANGDKNALAGEPEQIRIQAVLLNNQLIEKWNIRSTPYLVYRAKDGRIKIVQGKPERMAAVLSDLLM